MIGYFFWTLNWYVLWLRIPSPTSSFPLLYCTEWEIAPALGYNTGMCAPGVFTLLAVDLVGSCWEVGHGGLHCWLQCSDSLICRVQLGSHTLVELAHKACIAPETGRSIVSFHSTAAQTTQHMWAGLRLGTCSPTCKIRVFAIMPSWVMLRILMSLSRVRSYLAGIIWVSEWQHLWGMVVGYIDSRSESLELGQFWMLSIKTSERRLRHKERWTVGSWRQNSSQ